MSRTCVALVESATQLLNVAEWAQAAGDAPTPRIVVLAPTDVQSLRQLGRVADDVRAIGIRVDIRPVRVAGPGLPIRAAGVLADVARADWLIIGDPFSRYIHTVLPVARAAHVVIVDDGTATWDYATCVDSGAPLIRWNRPVARAKRHAVRATRRLSPSRRRNVDVFSCLHGATPVGAIAHLNSYAWTRSRWRPEVIDGQLDLLGTSLVGTGVIERRPYLDAIANQARAGAALRYIAHRRESENLVAEIATIPNVRVLRADQPAEILLRKGPVGRQVIAFPSTAAHTVPIVLADVDVRVSVLAVEPGWFTAQASARARSFVARIAAEARPRLPAMVLTPDL